MLSFQSDITYTEW